MRLQTYVLVLWFCHDENEIANMCTHFIGFFSGGE